MNIALVGCGFVSDFYLMTLPNHPELRVIGVHDLDRRRAAHVAGRHGVEVIFESLDDLLADPRVEVVVNLTNPSAHHAVSKAALEAGKHVYSEKPLAMTLEDARELVALARARGLELAGAPCNVLGAAAQTMWKAIRSGVIGPVRLVYAQLDDGMIPRQAHRAWTNWSDIPWPAKDEFEVGCTLEHSGYYLTWLAAFFGPARSVQATSRCLLEDKRIQLDRNAPDFSVALIEFEAGPLVRLTCSILAPTDHSITVVGENGVLSVEDCWFYASPVHQRRVHPKTGVLERPQGLALVRSEDWRFRYHAAASDMDYARGIAELASAVRERRACRLGAELTLHVTELALAIQHPERTGSPYHLTTRFDPVAPMDWAA